MELLIDGDLGVRTNGFRRRTYNNNLDVGSKAGVDHPMPVTCVPWTTANNTSSGRGHTCAHRVGKGGMRELKEVGQRNTPVLQN
jgi:hypothetical protein